MPVFNITPPDQRVRPTLQQQIDNKTKPPGSLGYLETLALQIGVLQGTLAPQLRRPVMMVFAGDHGITAAGISSFPQEVTQQMVLNFLAGGAAINVFSRQHGIAVRIIDAGVNHDFAPHAALIDAKVAKGTRNFLHEPAMSAAQCEQALSRGAALAAIEVEAGSNVLAFGEMGIGNTTAAAALMSVLCDLPPALCSGRGTGLDNAGLQRKISVIEQALQLHALQSADIEKVLTTLGGFEIAMMAGAMLGGAERGALLMIDGFIATSALLVASRIAPAILEYCVFCHCSDEAGHRLLLDQLGASPLLDLGLRLGEGTGAALAYPLLQSAVAFLNEMASFESAQVSGRSA